VQDGVGLHTPQFDGWLHELTGPQLGAQLGALCPHGL